MQFDTKQDAYLRFRSIVAERTSPIVAWVGSGLSAPLGLPTWAVLKRQLLEALQEKIDSYPSSDRATHQGCVPALERQSNPWVAFQMLRKALGAATYREVIREAVRPADTADPPALYKYLWRLRIRGLINLNIDRLATKACVEETANRAPLEFTAAQGTRLGFLLKETRPFILNVHGQADDSSTWVFTKDELDNLVALPAYHTFIRGCLSANTVLFVGLSVDDHAVGGHLEALASFRIDTGTHYWVTSRTDFATDRWAEAVGIRLIRYSAQDEDHSALEEMFADLLGFVSPEDPPVREPVVSSSSGRPSAVLPPAADLAKRDAEEIRQVLNAHVRARFGDPGPRTDEQYSAFRKAYDEAIYRAWYTSTEPHHNTLLSYRLDAPVARGAFGTVYRALAPSGEPVAIKVLLEEIRKNPDLLQSFRRGVRSMRILSQRKTDGVVAYRDYSEIPAFLVMDWVEGPSLEEAVHAHFVEDWHILLRIGRDLSQILRRAHLLPERVLHRDLRPSNVMLKDYHTDPDNWRVVVLDFDLSWHRGATEKSVTHGSTLFGYLAPEQIQRIRGVSTRHSAVDSFGLGMTLFFLVSRRHPIPDEHRHGSWPADVRRACQARFSDQWRSLPERIARLILTTTHDEQARRWDLAQVETELNRLLEAETEPAAVCAADLLAEELAARTDIFTGYKWDENLAAATVDLPTGLQLTLQGDVVKQLLVLDLHWRATGVHQHRKVGKWLKPAAQSSAAVLQRVGWRIEESNVDAQALNLVASVRADLAAGKLGELCHALGRATQLLQVE